MADIGLQGFPPMPDGVDRLTHIGRILERVPPEVTTVWIDDHLQFGDAPRFEGWTLLTYLAAAYPRFRYGHLVLSQSFRNPVLLAKMAATLGVRVEQLAEAIEVMRAMWTQSPASYEGRYYRIQGRLLRAATGSADPDRPSDRGNHVDGRCRGLDA